QKEKNVLLKLAQKKPDGIIFNASGFTENISYYKQVVAGNSNTVFVDGIYPDIKANFVCTERINAYTKMCQSVKDRNCDKVYYIDIDYWKIIKTNLDCLQGYKNVFGEENIILSTKPYFEIIDDFCNKLSEDILKYKKVGFVFINAATANIFYYNMKDIFKKIDDVFICCVDKPNFAIPKNMHVVWLKQNLSEIAKEAVNIIKQRPKEIKEILVPGEIEYINF
ncbi:MAG: LacI family DNA-binding transcriptional regulator, partial [Armatimonadetes bacterium]|nr:LacI family DNA-binding transcriptional regulator [Candidatus Hippobium faecium]